MAALIGMPRASWRRKPSGPVDVVYSGVGRGVVAGSLFRSAIDCFGVVRYNPNVPPSLILGEYCVEAQAALYGYRDARLESSTFSVASDFYMKPGTTADWQSTSTYSDLYVTGTECYGYNIFIGAFTPLDTKLAFMHRDGSQSFGVDTKDFTGNHDIITGLRYRAVGSFGSGVANLFVAAYNGPVSVYTNTNATSPAFNSSRGLRAYSCNADNAGFVLFQSVYWNRAVTGAEARSWIANPYQIFKPRNVRFYSLPSAGGGSTYNLISAINSLSSTPTISVLSVLRAITTALNSDTLTPSASVLVQRALSTAFSSSSYTPDTVTLNVAGLLALVTALTSQSTTPASSLIVQRDLASGVVSDSTTPNANANVDRSISTALASTSLTPDALASVVRAIATSLTSASTTSDTVTLNTSTVIALVTAVSSGSLTPSAALSIACALSTALNSDSTTANAAANVLRPQTTAISSQSTTSNAALDLLALLQIATSINSASSTSAASLALARAIASTIASLSTTSAPSLAVLRDLATALASASSVSAPNLLLGGDTIIAIQSLIASQSLTPDRVRLLTDLVDAIDSALRLRATVSRPEMTATGQPPAMTATDLFTN